jgi:type IV pilus assembly protein PilC
MNTDEFAFFNQQLAGMLRSGIPLEGALRQLCQGMRRGKLRSQIQLLERDLADGIPLKTAVTARKLPEMYMRVLIAGVESQNLPGMLTLLADYYAKASSITARLKGLMVYPLIVLVLSLALSIFLTLLYTGLMGEAEDLFSAGFGTAAGSNASQYRAFFWVAPAFFLGLLCLFILCASLNRVRRWFRWKLPGLKDASLAQSASALSLMLASGTQFESALGLLEQAEQRSPAARDLSRWRELLKAGAGKFNEIASESRVFPPLFVWLVAQSGEDLPEGFRRASEIYGARAQSRTDMLLYAALPLAIVFLGFLMLGQVYSIITLIVKAINAF